jgi:L-asparaginase
VTICFENKIYRGNRTHKNNAENFDAFVSSNYPVLAEAGVHIRYNQELITPPNFKKLKVHTSLDNNIAILKLFPGISEQSVKAVLAIEGLKAVILETYGSGNAPTNDWFIELLKVAIQSGIIVVNVTQCKGGGTVEIGKYETSILLGEIGVISGFDMTTEAAVSKLMFLLGSGKNKKEVELLMQKPLRGEMSI